MSRAPASLVTRLVRTTVLWAVPVLVAVALILTWLYRGQTYRLFDQPLESTVTALIAATEVEGQSVGLSREPSGDDYQRALSGAYWIIGEPEPTGIIRPLLASRSLYESTLAFVPRDGQQLLGQPGAELRTRTSGPDGEPLRVVARSVILPGSSRPVVIAAASDVREARAAVGRFGVIATALVGLLAAGLILAVWLQVRVGLAPLFDMRARVAEVREGTASRVEGTFPPELQPLATELNDLISHNRNVVERARTHVGNLAHALKTPIAVLRGEASGTPSREVVARQTEAMNVQVEHHLRRAQAAARGQVVGVSSDADKALSGLARTLTRIYGRDGKRISTDFPDNLVFRGERRDLEEMVGNLLDNACKWAAGEVRLSARVSDGRLRVVVEDDGPGIAEADMETALKRGERLDEQVPGTGLGLSIVDELAGAYNGSLTLGRSPLGGLRAALDLPGRLD